MSTLDDSTNTANSASPSDDNAVLGEDPELPQLPKLAISEKRITELLNLFGRTKSMLDHDLAVVSQTLSSIPPDKHQLLEEWRLKVSSWWRQYLPAKSSTFTQPRNLTYYNPRFSAPVPVLRPVSWSPQQGHRSAPRQHVWQRLGNRGDGNFSSFKPSQDTQGEGDDELSLKTGLRKFDWTSAPVKRSAADLAPLEPGGSNYARSYKRFKRSSSPREDEEDDDEDERIMPELFHKTPSQTDPQAPMKEQSDELISASIPESNLNGDDGQLALEQNNGVSSGKVVSNENEEEGMICYNCFERGHSSKQCIIYDADSEDSVTGNDDSEGNLEIVLPTTDDANSTD